MTALRRWYNHKYKLPVTSTQWLGAYVDDLATEFFEDLLEQDEELAREMRLKHLGYEVALTGDPLVDMWERQHAQGLVPDLDHEEPENAKERDRKVRDAARRHYAEHGRGSFYKAPLPDEALSIEDIEDRREGLSPDLSRFGLSEREITFDEHGYPVGTGGMSPAAFDMVGNAGRGTASVREDEALRGLNFEVLKEFADVGEAHSKKR